MFVSYFPYFSQTIWGLWLKRDSLDSSKPIDTYFFKNLRKWS
jgi:hypothetical protein